MNAAQDFYRLRREGIGHIELTGSAAWTDYNTHDPGISILEALAYAITDLAYRTNFPITDILAAATDQAFFTAAAMLTVNPTTAEDLRRVLIDADRVRNAWVTCDGCPCDAAFYAWCEDGELVLAYDPRRRRDPEIPFARVDPRGLYRVLVDLEADPELGDLGDRKIVRRRAIVGPDGRRHVVTLEVRFPAWGPARRDERRRLAEATGPFTVAVAGPNRTPAGTSPVDDAELRTHWSDVFFVDHTIGLADGTEIVIENATLRVFGDGAARRQATVAGLLAWLGDATPEGFVAPYGRKLAATDAAIASARAVLHAHRNLDEDFCRVDPVEIEEIAVCADVRVETTADIELVQARIWYAIERYLDPPVAFSSLDELRAAGEPTEAIFNGPGPASGFLTEQALRDADLRTELRVSDILNLLIDIDGVISVDNLLLTGHDALGVPIAGAADPDRVDGAAERISASWLLLVRPGHRPRLHRGLSRFLFTADGLPFVARLDEAQDTLVQLHGQAARPKIPAAELDLPVPAGRNRRLEAYQPVQHGFPLTYGIGRAGLPSTATAARRAQAAQLKAYLMVFEQLLRNAYAQLAQAGELFTLDPAVDHTYFTGFFTGDDIAGLDDVVDPALTAERLAGLAETPTEFLDRRNRFLDHLLARFAESFAEYAMLLTDLQGQGRAREALIGAKLAFLRALPRLGHDRGRAFDRTLAPCDPDNTPGLQDRVHLLLGLPGWLFGSGVSPSGNPVLTVDELGQRVMTFTPPVDPRAILAELSLRDRTALVAAGDGWQVTVPGGTTEREFRTRGEAEEFRALIATWAAHRRAVVVEHLLLRPKFPGDALFPACTDGSCPCGEEDPYSFRLTYVMPGWTEPFSSNLTVRRFADTTIRAQTPAHLLVKICWVGHELFERFADAWCGWAAADAAIDWTVERLHDTVLDLLARAAPAAAHERLCACATTILAEFGTQFRTWMDAELAAGVPVEQVTGFDPPDLTACADLALDPAVTAAIRDLLVARYAGYTEVSYRLSVLVGVLADLRNTYPRATLHDCDAGSDLNPVRLGQTALGSN